MAVIQAVSNSAVLTLNWSGATRTWKNVLGLVATGGTPVFSQGTVEAIYTALRGASTTTAFMAVMAPTVILESVSLRNFGTPNQPVFTSTGAALSGGGTGDALPLSTASCVTLRTALAGKSFRGRVYLTGFTEASNDANGRITSTAAAAGVAFINGINNATIPSFLALAVLSRPRNGKTIPAKTHADYAGTVNQVLSVIGRNLKWESQRRRTGRT